jgi:hypothetical protein
MDDVNVKANPRYNPRKPSVLTVDDKVCVNDCDDDAIMRAFIVSNGCVGIRAKDPAKADAMSKFGEISIFAQKRLQSDYDTRLCADKPNIG